MKKSIALFLLLAAIFALTGCTDAKTPETNAVVPQTTAAAAAAEAARPSENAAGAPMVSSPVLDAIIDKCGMPFRLWSATNEDMCEITVYEGYAVRVADRKDDNSYQEDRLSWMMEENQLSLNGIWVESFTLNPETMEAVSNDDGRVYTICAEQ